VRSVWDGWKYGDPLYVTCGFDGHEVHEHWSDKIAPVWTISPAPDATGWENDSGVAGYGLPKYVAEVLVATYRTKITAEVAPLC